MEAIQLNSKTQYFESRYTACLTLYSLSHMVSGSIIKKVQKISYIRVRVRVSTFLRENTLSPKIMILSFLSMCVRTKYSQVLSIQSRNHIAFEGEVLKLF